MGRVPEVTEILQRGQVLLSAKGGNGEPGRHGGNGQTGLPGKPGEKATEDVDATVRTFLSRFAWKDTEYRRSESEVVMGAMLAMVVGVAMEVQVA